LGLVAARLDHQTLSAIGSLVLVNAARIDRLPSVLGGLRLSLASAHDAIDEAVILVAAVSSPGFSVVALLIN